MDDKEILNMLLFDTMQSMKQEGLVDDHFISLYSLKKYVEDTFCVDVVTNFCSDTRDILKLLTQIISDLVVDFNLMEECTIKVKGSALSVGARRVAVAFTNFQSAIHTASKEECLMALNEAEHEYSALEEKLHLWIQLERRIITLPVMQRSSEELNLVNGKLEKRIITLPVTQRPSEEFNLVNGKEQPWESPPSPPCVAIKPPPITQPVQSTPPAMPPSSTSSTVVETLPIRTPGPPVGSYSLTRAGTTIQMRFMPTPGFKAPPT